MDVLKPLETSRLLLRTWNKTDREALIALNQDTNVMEHFPSIMTSYETALMLERMIAHFNEWGYGLWAAELKETKECIGFIGLSHPRFENEMTPCVEIGWRLKYEYWGKGLATEGAKEVLRYAFEDLDISHLNSWTAIPNKGSERVMQKIGMKYKGTFLHPNLPPNDPLCEHVIYSITQQEYRVFS